MVQAGIVNSSANTVASGSSVTLSAQRYCAPKWLVLRATCRPMRESVTPCRRAGRARPAASTMASPQAERIVRISKMLERPRQLADRHRHDRERQQRAGHPQHDADHAGEGHGEGSSTSPRWTGSCERAARSVTLSPRGRGRRRRRRVRGRAANSEPVARPSPGRSLRSRPPSPARGEGYLGARHSLVSLGVRLVLRPRLVEGRQLRGRRRRRRRSWGNGRAAP